MPEVEAGLAVELTEAQARGGPPTDLAPPGGALLLVTVDGEPAAIGGIRGLDTDVAEVKSMYVAPAGRGRGIAKRLLGRLEALAADHGCRAVRLDTAAHLSAAIAMYRAVGYREIPRYNENPAAALWFERELSPRPAP
jgi:GNAT superfamily N-acetyltransferase